MENYDSKRHHEAIAKLERRLSQFDTAADSRQAFSAVETPKRPTQQRTVVDSATRIPAKRTKCKCGNCGTMAECRAIKYENSRFMLCANCVQSVVPPFPLPSWHNGKAITKAQDRELRMIKARFREFVFSEIVETGHAPSIRVCAFLLGRVSDRIGAKYRNEIVTEWNRLHPELWQPILQATENSGNDEVLVALATAVHDNPLPEEKQSARVMYY